jgi:hypothetical protein
VREHALPVHARTLKVRGRALAVRARADAGMRCALEFFARALFGARCIPRRADSIPLEMEPSLTGTESPHAGTLSPLLSARRIPVGIQLLLLGIVLAPSRARRIPVGIQLPLSGIVLAQSRARCIPAGLCRNPAGTETPLGGRRSPPAQGPGKKTAGAASSREAVGAKQKDASREREERGGFLPERLHRGGVGYERTKPVLGFLRGCSLSRRNADCLRSGNLLPACNESCQPAEGNDGLPLELEPGAKT